MNLNLRGAIHAGSAEKSFLTVKQAAETSGLGVSTIRLLIRRRQLKAQKVGSRVLIKRSDLENFLESHPIEVIDNDSQVDSVRHFSTEVRNRPNSI